MQAEGDWKGPTEEYQIQKIRLKLVRKLLLYIDETISIQTR